MMPPARKLSRRKFIFSAIAAAPLLAVGDALWLEPGWLKVRRVRLCPGAPTHRLVHFTDLHHKGDRHLLQAVVKKINALAPDFVCFTGDLIEESSYLAEALEILSGIKSPLYGVPGNHDYWAQVSFDEFARCFAATGGGWLMDRHTLTRDGRITLIGASSTSFKKQFFRGNPATKNIVLMHYPAWVQNLEGMKFDLLLAGHSHGGQVRLPFYGPIYIPYAVGAYDMGLFHTPSGPLYVNPGIGYFPVRARFNCRPEITLIEI